MKKSVWLIIALIIIALAAIIIYTFYVQKPGDIQNQDQVFQYNDLVKVEHPSTYEKVSSPLEISGEARGNWYFEAVFPVVLYDGDGNLLANGLATATDDWMTENYVPFTATLEFDKPTVGDGVLFFVKDNPSGLPENDDSFEIPVKF